jgi:hypothetical protein
MELPVREPNRTELLALAGRASEGGKRVTAFTQMFSEGGAMPPFPFMVGHL